jgi:hypothetical protein
MTNHGSYHCSTICSKRDIALVRQRHQCNGLFPAVEASKFPKQCMTPADHILRIFFPAFRSTFSAPQYSSQVL